MSPCLLSFNPSSSFSSSPPSSTPPHLLHSLILILNIKILLHRLILQSSNSSPFLSARSPMLPSPSNSTHPTSYFLLYASSSFPSSFFCFIPSMISISYTFSSTNPQLVLCLLTMISAHLFQPGASYNHQHPKLHHTKEHVRRVKSEEKVKDKKKTKALAHAKIRANYEHFLFFKRKGISSTFHRMTCAWLHFK